MKIALLARNPHLYSHRRICEAARARGHEIEVINTLACLDQHHLARPALYYRKRRLEDFDAVIPRIGASVTFYGLAVLRQFEVMGIYPLNESVAIGRSRDKLRCLQLLARRGIGLPVTAYTHDPRQAEDIIDLVGGRAGGHQAARRHPRHRRGARRHDEIGEVGDRGVSGRQRQHPGAGVHQGGRLDRHPRARHRREGGGGDEAVRDHPASSAPICIAAARARRCASRRRSAALRSRPRAPSASMCAASICCAPRAGRWCSRSTPRRASRGWKRRPGSTWQA